MRRCALDLWRNAKFREERYAAIALTDLRRHCHCQTIEAVPIYEQMIVTGAWWDYVDWIASHQLGAILRHDPDRMKPLMRRWAASDDSMWKRRAAMLCQLRFKQETDLALLYDCIEPNLGDRDFFIRKAIGWALRQYAWTDAREVRRYVTARRDRLSPLSVREALKNIGADERRTTMTVPPTSERQVRTFLAKYSPGIAARGRAARRRMRQALPGWSELVYDNYNALVFGFSPTERPSDAVFSIALYPKWVRLFFLRNGPLLHDPHNLLTGKGARVRSLVLQSAADLDSPAVRALMQQAMAGIARPRPGRPPATTVRSVSARQRPRRRRP
jgi:3-methyladenine DNA glycosylase AlkD